MKSPGRCFRPPRGSTGDLTGERERSTSEWIATSGVLFLDDVDMKSSPTGIIVRPPGTISLRSAIPGMFHDWYPTEYCRVVVHPNEITVVDVQFNGKLERSADGTFVSRPTCKCLIQALRDKSNDSGEIPTCE
jgi:hypothetical protein